MKRQKWIYFVPFFGWACSIQEWAQAWSTYYRVLSKDDDPWKKLRASSKALDATWEPFEYTFIGCLTTILGMMLLGCVVLVLMSNFGPSPGRSAPTPTQRDQEINDITPTLKISLHPDTQIMYNPSV